MANASEPHLITVLVEWRRVGKHPHPVAMSVLAVDRDKQDGEWRFELINCPTEKYLALFEYWIPLGELAPSQANRTLDKP